MSYPSADPKRLQIVNRVVEVLKDIVAGASYWYTPAAVEKRVTHFQEVLAFPHYSVSLDSGGKLTDGLGTWKSEEFYINVKGVVDDANGDAVDKIARCLRDVRYAIDQDSRSTATGSLGQLVAALFIEDAAETDNGYLSIEGRGFFEQRIKVVIAGTIEQL